MTDDRCHACKRYTATPHTLYLETRETHAAESGIVASDGWELLRLDLCDDCYADARGLMLGLQTAIDRATEHWAQQLAEMCREPGKTGDMEV